MSFVRNLFFITLIIVIPISGYTQNLSIGLQSGINFSDLQGNEYDGIWKHKVGPSEGIVLDYSISDVFGIRTGLDFSAVYYEFQAPKEYVYMDPFWFATVSLHKIDYKLPPDDLESMSFSKLTIPVQFYVEIPLKKIGVQLASGFYYSYFLENSLNNINEELSTGESDLGFINSLGITYPMGGKIDANLYISYFNGLDEMFEDSKLRHASTSFTLGFNYKIFSDRIYNYDQPPEEKSIRDDLYFSVNTGVNLSWNSGNISAESYNSRLGNNLGFSLGIEMGGNAYLKSGLSIESLGYRLADSSDLLHVKFVQGSAEYKVDTKVRINYLQIPLLMEFYIGKKELFYFNTGPYMGLRFNAICSGTGVFFSRRDGVYEKFESTVVYDIEKDIKPQDFGWITGLGIALPFPKNQKLNIGLSYRIGFDDILNQADEFDELELYSRDRYIKNSSISLLIGLKLPIYK